LLGRNEAMFALDLGRSDAGCAGAGEVSPNVSPVVLSLPSVPAPSEDAGPVPAVTTSDDAGLRRAVHLLPHRVRPRPRPEPRLLHGRRRGQTRPKVISIQFLDFDTEGTLLVINQDDTYEDVAFTDGQTVEFTSISAKLDPDEPLSEQLNKVPGGAQLTLRGRAVNDDTGLETIVSVRLTWSYTNACDEVPLAEGMELAWVTFDNLTPAAEAFCPAVAPDATKKPTAAPTKKSTRCPRPMLPRPRRWKPPRPMPPRLRRWKPPGLMPPRLRRWKRPRLMPPRPRRWKPPRLMPLRPRRWKRLRPMHLRLRQWKRPRPTPLRRRQWKPPRLTHRRPPPWTSPRPMRLTQLRWTHPRPWRRSPPRPPPRRRSPPRPRPWRRRSNSK